ncbi:MAG TPA: YraN family protein [Chloroflexota bacterium]|nr:YraN family protein [Chloroflexota bacterium]
MLERARLARGKAVREPNKQVDARAGLGRAGEDRAAAYLAKQGYRIIERNWRTSFGELDIVASQGATLVLVEVRTRTSGRDVTPEASVTASKQRRLARLGEAYVARNSYEGDWRIDVIAIDQDGLRHLVSAIEQQ